MSFAKKFNKSSVVFDINTEKFNFCSLSDLQELSNGATLKLLGLFINTKSRFGATPCAIIENGIVNLPEHLLNTVQTILDTEDAVDTIKNGLVGITVREYTSKNPKAKGKKCYTIDFVDIESSTDTLVIDVPKIKK